MRKLLLIILTLFLLCNGCYLDFMHHITVQNNASASILVKVLDEYEDPRGVILGTIETGESKDFELVRVERTRELSIILEGVSLNIIYIIKGYEWEYVAINDSSFGL